MTAAEGVGLPNPTIQKIKYCYSSVLLVFCVSIVMGLIFTEQTELAHDIHPAFAFFVCVGCIVWLTMVEGGQGAIVGLGPVNGSFFKDTHFWSHMCTSTVHKGDNLDRYLLGRQFMVILIVFTLELSSSPMKGAELWGFPAWLTNMFLSSGLAMIFFTCMVGQLNSEINGCHCMLDYINNWFAFFTVGVALIIEFSGILHFCYIVQAFCGYVGGMPIVSQEPPRTLFHNVFFYGRCVWSFGLLCFSFAVTLKALFDGNTTMWDFMPPIASVAIFFALLAVIGFLEGSQIAYFAMAKLRECERGESYFAKATCALIFTNHNHNLAAFMIGRQLMVVSCMFFIARITAVRIGPEDENLYGVSDGVQNLFNTGLLGAHIVAIIGSVSWRLLASAFPHFFMATPITYVFLRIALFLEGTGLLHGAWVLAFIHKKCAGFQRDEVYIGTAEERAAKQLADDSKILNYGPGHPVPATDVGENPIDWASQGGCKSPDAVEPTLNSELNC